MVALHQPEPDGSERRVAPRMRTLKRAKIVFNGGFSTFDCVVRNISATGALLTIDETVHLPREFEIRVGEEQEARPAKLVYRRGLFAGIRFLDIVDDMADPRTQAEAGVDASKPGTSATSGGKVGPGRAASGGIRRIQPESLPQLLRDLFPWS